MLRRKLFGIVAAGLATAMVVTGCSSSSSSGSSTQSGSASASGATGDAPAEIRIGYQAVPGSDLIVKNNKWLETAFPNTKITWTKFESGGDVNTAFIAGSLDIGLAGSSPVTAGLSAPLNIAYQVPWIFDVIGDAEALVVKKDSGITDVKGLAGKKVGVPFASTSHYSLLAALKENGVDPASVTIVDLQPTDILAAWQRGDIQGAYVWSPTLDELKKDGTVLVSSKQLAEKGYPTYDLSVVSKPFVEKYPNVITEWIKQQNKGVELIKNDPKAASEAIAAQLSITPAEAQTQLNGLVFLTIPEQQSEQFLGTPEKPGKFADGLLKAAEFLYSQKKIDAVPTLATLQAGINTTPLANAAK